MKKGVKIFISLLIVFIIFIETVSASTTPVITLLGDNQTTVGVGTVYTDAGATLNNLIPINENTTILVNVDGILILNLTITKTSDLDTSNIGNYTVTYSTVDSEGNIVTAIRNVSVADMTPPIITLNGDNPLIIEVNTSYTELGATALDNVDGDLTSNIIIFGEVNTSVLGEYTINYTVSDNAGNQATVTRKINVIYTPPYVPPSGSGGNSGSNTGGRTRITPFSNSTNNNSNANSIKENSVPITNTDKGVIGTGSAILNFTKSGFGILAIIFLIIIIIFVAGIFISRRKRYLKYGN